MTPRENDERDEREEGRELALSKLVDVVVNTPKDRMSSMTVLTRVQAHHCTMLEVNESLADYLVKVIEAGLEGDIEEVEGESISEVFRFSLYNHNLSIDGKLRGQVNDLALEQIGMESEEEGETPYDQR